MVPWILVVFLLLVCSGLVWLLLRAARRLLEFDELLRIIIDPMQEYQAELAKIATAEGLLTDHPEVVAFHRANVVMLAKINAAITSVKEARPQEPEVKGNPPVVE